MTSLKRDGQPPVEVSEVSSKSQQDRSTPTIPTRVGRDAVDIDVRALKHLVDTVKDKLKP